MTHLILILFTAFSISFGQQDKLPCSMPAASQFDFWLGEWNLSWGDSGEGTNTVKKILNNCIIQENFDGTPSIKLIGMSVSTYSPSAGKWFQTWVDNHGSYLDFSGKFENERMILSRTLEKNDKKILQRMVWYNITSDSLDWNWESSADDGKSWQLNWKIHYQRKK